MRLLLSVLAVLALGGTANAQSEFPKDIKFCWTNPSQYVDGSTIAPGDLTLIRIEVYRNNDTVPTFTFEKVPSGEGLSECATLPAAIPNPGTYFGVGYAESYGVVSDPTPPTEGRKYTGKPAPITPFVVE